jgi:hypothetical protein
MRFDRQIVCRTMAALVLAFSLVPKLSLASYVCGATDRVRIFVTAAADRAEAESTSLRNCLAYSPRKLECKKNRRCQTSENFYPEAMSAAVPYKESARLAVPAGRAKPSAPKPKQKSRPREDDDAPCYDIFGRSRDIDPASGRDLRKDASGRWLDGRNPNKDSFGNRIDRDALGRCL